MNRAFPFLLLAAARVSCADLDPALVKEARENMASYLAAVPDYVCSVSIDRYRKDPRGRERLSDRVRLEVAFAGGKELYGLAGATRFEDVPIGRLLKTGGSMSTGSYALHIREVFATDRPVFTAAEKLRHGGRDFVRLAFTIPRARSQLRASDGSASAAVGYSGEVWLEAATWRPAELRVQLDDIPPPLRFRAAGERTLYHEVRIAGRAIALPASTELTILTAGGTEMRNHVQFQNCRNFRAESTISFDVPTAGDADASQPLTVPRGASFEAELLTPIAKDFAIGEALTAKLTEPAGSAPAGATVAGNITAARRVWRRSREYYELGIRFVSVTAGSRSGVFRGRIEAVDPPPKWRDSILLRPPNEGDALLLVEVRRLPLKSGLRLQIKAE